MTPFANIMRQHLLTNYAPKAQLFASTYGQGQPGDAREIRSGPDLAEPDPTPPPTTNVEPPAQGPAPGPSPIQGAVGDVSGLDPGPTYDPAHGVFNPAWVAAIHGGGGLVPGDPGYTPQEVHSSYGPGTVFTPGLEPTNPDGTPATRLPDSAVGPVLGGSPAPAPAPAPAPVYGPETGVYSPAWVEAMHGAGNPIPGEPGYQPLAPAPAPVAPAPAAPAPAAPPNLATSAQDARDMLAAQRARRTGGMIP